MKNPWWPKAVCPPESPYLLSCKGWERAHTFCTTRKENKREREKGVGFNYYPHSRRIAVLKLAPHTTSGICPLVLYAATLHTIPCYYVTRSRVPTGTSLSQKIKEHGGGAGNRTLVSRSVAMSASPPGLSNSPPKNNSDSLRPPRSWASRYCVAL